MLVCEERADGRALHSPDMPFYLTTPIYYVNATPHIGHAYTTIAADILVRHHRQRGEDAFLLTGVDEHATKVYRVAQEAGPRGAGVRRPHRRGVARRCRAAVGAEPDFYIRTSDDGHKAFVRDFLQRIYDNGDVYEDVYAGLYCVGCEAFKSEDELVDGKCPEHGDRVEYIEEKNYFFRLSAYQERLLALYDERPDFVLPDFRYNEARSFIAGGLQDFSISRAGQPWGIPLPWDESQVAYVWADALVNYLSALSATRVRARTSCRCTGLRLATCSARTSSASIACTGRRCSCRPGTTCRSQLFVHGYLTMEGAKISKSLGNVIDPLPLVGAYGSDPVRYWAIRSATSGETVRASEDALHERYERELANELGNLVSRTTAMIARYRDGELPCGARQPRRCREARRPPRRDPGATRRLGADRARWTSIWDVVRELNRVVERSKPWELAKDEAKSAELDRVLYDLADGVRSVAVALYAYLPATSTAILRALGQGEDVAWGGVRPGGLAPARIEPAPPLFPRVERAAV